MTNEEVKQILINTYAKDDSELSMFNIEMRNAIFYCEDVNGFSNQMYLKNFSEKQSTLFLVQSKNIIKILKNS